ncbi:MAG: YceI family protein [Bacteroidia bacterium]
MKTTWSADPSHSEVTFKVKHMMITNVTGIMKEYTIDAETEGDDFRNATVKFTGKTASIDTGNDQRDAHLSSEEFFDVKKYPEITFVSTAFEKQENNTYRVTGDLTIRGITKKVDLAVDYGGQQKDPWGNTKAGFSVRGVINRKDFGLNWNTILETGGVMVSEDVKIECDIEMVRS